MKKIILFAFLSVAILFGRQNVNAQITVDHVYTTNPPYYAVKLSSGLKYVAIQSTSPPVTTTNFVLYNPDHSIFRAINVPQISGKYAGFVSFVSDALFDLDTLIEYMLAYADSITAVRSVAVLNETGNTLLYVDSAFYSFGQGAPNLGYIEHPIFPDGNQTKLYLFTNYVPTSGFYTTTVYNLPGRLACLECDSGLVNGLAQPPGLPSEDMSQLKAFPNPNDGNATIEFKLPQGINSGEIVLYKMDGSEVKRYRVDGTFGNLILNNTGLGAGAYMYQLVAGNRAVDAKKMIVIK
ncbi:MAG TPA: T9SS type A sorting domain-containing protein [Bacteroidia bacterium]|nr:T9SS type A sorting domain-containing protein [Bacteroidia bacterium]